MKAPTNVTGPDGTIVQRGQEIPAAWFKELPDLKDHLDALDGPPAVLPIGSRSAQDRIDARNAAVEATHEDSGTTPKASVRATATVGRTRGANP